MMVRKSFIFFRHATQHLMLSTLYSETNHHVVDVMMIKSHPRNFFSPFRVPHNNFSITHGRNVLIFLTTLTTSYTAAVSHQIFIPGFSHLCLDFISLSMSYFFCHHIKLYLILYVNIKLG